MTTVALEKDLASVVRHIREPDCWRDPYPYYRQLREDSPVLRSADGKLILTGHGICEAVLRDARWEHFPELLCMSSQIFENNSRVKQPAAPKRPDILDSIPDRRSLRQRLAREFAPRVVLPLEGRIRHLADDLLDQTATGSLDLIDAVVVPFTSTVIAEAFGVPPVDRQIFRKWSSTLRQAAEASFVPAGAKGGPDADELAATSREVDDYMKALIAERRREPTDDVVSMLVSASGDGTQWSDEAIISTLVSIIVVGHHTTTAFIGNSALALVQHPDQFAWLGEQPDLAPQAIEELLRYDSPAQFVSRYALEDMELGGYHFETGDIALLFIGAANRDPESYPEPERLDLTRNAGNHLAFSLGHAYCFGAPLARLAGRLFFTALSRRLRGLTLDGDPAHFDTIGLRGIAALPVRVN